LIPKWIEHFRETSRLSHPVEAEHSFTHHGQIHWISMTVSALPGGSGTPNRFCYVAADTTDKKQLEQQFLRAQRLESVGTLASGIAHDLNNVLAPIVMSLRLFRSKLPGTEDQEVLTGMESSARRGADIIRQLLTFARGAEGVRHAVDVGALIGDLAKMLRDTCPRSIRIETAVASDLGAVIGDATQIYQVLMNLCVNARDAMPAGGLLRLAAGQLPAQAGVPHARSALDSGDWILLTVSDTGCGIAPGILDKIFDPFFTTKAASFGTGLGLSTAQSIVKSHGGLITVTSQINQGTEFKVFLPMHSSAPAPADATPAIVPARGRGELILVVDDEPAVRLVTRATLLDHGYRVVTAGDGNEALSVFLGEGKAVHLVLTDMMLPSMDGAALVRSLRELSPGLKAIAMSGLLNGKALAESPGLASTTFLQKPFTAECLLQCVAEALKP
jgi:signal transduction histidine kinase/CheY-like chemotaxis protein